VLDTFITWLRNTENWLIGVIPFLGAFVALARSYEKSDQTRTIRQLCNEYLKLLAYSWVGALLGVNAAEHYALSKQLTIIACLLGSVFAKGILDMIWAAAQVRYQKLMEKLK
jgi:hypothetical protein